MKTAVRNSSKKLHIAMVTAYPPSKGSLNEYGYHLARALGSKASVGRMSIVGDVLDEQVADAELVPDAELGVEAAQASFDLERVWSFNDARSAGKINRALARLAPDAVVFNLQFASFGDQRVPAALGLLAPWQSQRQRPTVTLLHNLFEMVSLADAGYASNPFSNLLTMTAGHWFTHALLKSGKVAVTMPRYREILENRYGASNVFHAPHGSFEAPAPIAPLPEVPTVMTFGKFGTYKKVEILLEAHRELLKRDRSVRLVIAGSDSPNAKGYLKDVAARYKNLPNVTFWGYVAEEDVPRVFTDSTVVAFPYESTTGSSGVLHQAGQFGRAAVMPRIGDLADLVTDEGYNANFFTRGDVESLMAALTDVLFNKEKANALGEANHAASSLTLADVSERYLAAIRDLQEREWTSAPKQARQDAPIT